MAYRSSQLEIIRDAMNNPEPADPAPQTRILTVDRCGGCYAEVSGHKCNYCGTIYRETKFTEDEKQEWFEIRQHFNPKGSTINERREQLGLEPIPSEDDNPLDSLLLGLGQQPKQKKSIPEKLMNWIEK